MGGGGVIAAQRYSGSLTGRVGGDVFRFRVAGSQGADLTGELTVSGDEMEGLWTVQAVGGLGGVPLTSRISLRRIPSPPRPQTPSP